MASNNVGVNAPNNSLLLMEKVQELIKSFVPAGDQTALEQKLAEINSNKGLLREMQKLECILLGIHNSDELSVENQNARSHDILLMNALGKDQESHLNNRNIDAELKAKEDKNKYKLAVLFQMTFPGMPSIFYGDELEISGVLEKDYRKPMPWGKKSDLFEFYKDLISLRKEIVALRDGKYRCISAKQGSKVYAYERFTDTESMVIIMNMGVKEDVTKILPKGKMVRCEGFDGSILDTCGYIIIQR